MTVAIREGGPHDGFGCEGVSALTIGHEHHWDGDLRLGRELPEVAGDTHTRSSRPHKMSCHRESYKNSLRNRDSSTSQLDTVT